MCCRLREIHFERACRYLPTLRPLSDPLAVILDLMSDTKHVVLIHRASTAAAIVVDGWLDQHRWHRQRWLRPECVEIFALSRPQPLPKEYLNET